MASNTDVDWLSMLDYPVLCNFEMPATDAALHLQAMLAAAGTARNVIVVGAIVKMPADAATPAICGTRSSGPSVSALPLSRNVESCKFAASRVKRSETLAIFSECEVFRSLLITSSATPPGVPRWQWA